jgi:putative nucleotidyltransferase with HDIG domain
MNYALAIVDELGDVRINRTGVRFGAILHDIGKIHIRDDMLRKTGPLNPDEWREMEQHPIVGAEMVKDIPFLAPAIPIIRYHHERWDGKGYPNGLASEAIPLSARIVAVADSYDAMTTDRPYRDALLPHQAYENILLSRGVRYDPRVVDAFQRAWVENKVQPFLVGS